MENVMENKRKMLTTWAARKTYIYASAALAGTFGILTLILSHLGIAGAWMAVLTGFCTVASLIYLFVHIYIISFSDCEDF